MKNTEHEKYMKLCFDLALKGAGHVSPNPLVGALIVKDGEIISAGYHQQYGGLHAERNAIDNARKDLSGSTLYCNFEPCMHTDKQTPPCVPAIISYDIKRVVISNIDPNPKVKGSGIKILKDAGVEVISGVLEEEGRELNRFFFKYMETGLPYITVKIAESSDGKITAAEGTQTWLTGEESKKFVHKQRSFYDAVLIGAGTVNIDNPQLTVREAGGRNPARIIVDGNLNSNIEAKIFNDKESRTIVFCSVYADEKKKSAFIKRGVEIIDFETGSDNRINLLQMMQKISEMRILSLLVEGGGKIFNRFVSQRLFDELFVLQAPANLNGGIDSITIDKMENLYLLSQEKLGDDILTIYKPGNRKYVHGTN